MNHLALFLLLPAAWLTWRWSRLVSGALWLTLVATVSWLATSWEPLRAVSFGTGLMGVVGLATHDEDRPRALSSLLVASMGVDLAALLIHRGVGQWGPLPFFQCIVLLAMCGIAWPRRTL
jgi:hypothetical protein